MIKTIRTGYAYTLLTLSVISILVLLATGHQISLSDRGQLKLILEATVFLLTGFAILKRHLTGNVLAIILLVLTELSLVDIYLELSNEHGAAGITTLIIVMALLNLYLIYEIIKNKKTTGN
jgi:hypothetical protein